MIGIHDPSDLDNKINYHDTYWYNGHEFLDPYGHHPLNVDGSYTYREVTTLHQLIDDPIKYQESITYTTNALSTSNNEVDHTAIQPRLGWVPLNIIQCKFENTTQYVRNIPLYGEMRKHYKSRFPNFNVEARNEPVATDTILADTAAIDDGSTCAQIFVGRHISHRYTCYEI
jgi:hypothetical protein